MPVMAFARSDCRSVVRMQEESYGDLVTSTLKGPNECLDT